MKAGNIIILLLALCPFRMQAEEWEPIGTWPFEYRTFQVATVYTGVFNVKKTLVPCNIHLGNQSLWFVQNDTLMEALPGTVRRVEFKNGDTYIPVGNKESYGKIIREDTLAGKVSRVIQVRLVDQRTVDQRAIDLRSLTQNLQQSSLDLGSWGAQLAEINSPIREEELPLPLTYTFYFQYNGEVFEAKESKILQRIDPERRKEYKKYTRSAEIISSSSKSMLKVWQDFFVNYSKKTQ